MRGDSIYYGQPVQPGHPLNRGLTAWYAALPWWKQGPRLRDLVNKNHGVLSPSTGLPTWRGARGRPGGYGCLEFNGTNHYVDLGSTWLDVSGEYTIACWINTTT